VGEGTDDVTGRPLWVHSLRPLNQAAPPEPIQIARRWTRADTLVVVAFGIAASIFTVGVVAFLSWAK
jgi:hypothetical protein